MNPFDLTGTTALVSGSSRGIGLALAKGLLQAGSRVTIHGRNIDQVKTTALDLAEETGGQLEIGSAPGTGTSVRARIPMGTRISRPADQDGASPVQSRPSGTNPETR